MELFVCLVKESHFWATWIIVVFCLCLLCDLCSWQAFFICSRFYHLIHTFEWHSGRLFLLHPSTHWDPICLLQVGSLFFPFPLCFALFVDVNVIPPVQSLRSYISIPVELNTYDCRLSTQISIQTHRLPSNPPSPPLPSVSIPTHARSK